MGWTLIYFYLSADFNSTIVLIRNMGLTAWFTSLCLTPGMHLRLYHRNPTRGNNTSTSLRHWAPRARRGHRSAVGHQLRYYVIEFLIQSTCSFAQFYHVSNLDHGSLPQFNLKEIVDTRTPIFNLPKNWGGKLPQHWLLNFCSELAAIGCWYCHWLSISPPYYFTCFKWIKL